MKYLFAQINVVVVSIVVSVAEMKITKVLDGVALTYLSKKSLEVAPLATSATNILKPLHSINKRNTGADGGITTKLITKIKNTKKHKNFTKYY